MTDIEDAQTVTHDAPTTAETGSQDAPTTEEVPATPREPEGPDAPSVAERSTLLGELIVAIRTAVAPGASTEARANGATACRAILTALEAQVGQPLAPARPAPATAAAATLTPTSPLARMLSQLTAIPREQLAGMLSQLAAMPREQLIDLVVQRLRSALPAGASTQPIAGPRFHLIQIPQPRSRGAGS